MQLWVSGERFQLLAADGSKTHLNGRLSALLRYYKFQLQLRIKFGGKRERGRQPAVKKYRDTSHPSHLQMAPLEVGGMHYRGA